MYEGSTPYFDDTPYFDVFWWCQLSGKPPGAFSESRGRSVSPSAEAHCTSSPKRLRRGRQACTFFTFSFLALHSLPRIILCRTVSLHASFPWLLRKYSAANVGPKSRRRPPIRSPRLPSRSPLGSTPIRRLSAQPVDQGLVAALFQRA